MREKFLKTVGQLAAKRPWWMLLFISLLTIVSIQLAGRLTVNSNMTEMFPKTHPMVQEFDLLMNEFRGSSAVIIAVEGKEKDMVAFADAIADDIVHLDKWIVDYASKETYEQHQNVKQKEKDGIVEKKQGYFFRVDYKAPQEFIKNHGLMLADAGDLKNTAEMFINPNLPEFLTNLNNSLEKEYIQSEEKLSTIQKERNAVSFLDGIESWVEAIENGLYADSVAAGEAAANAVTLGNPYLISADRSMLLMMAMPTFNMMEMDHVMPAINGLEELTKLNATKHNVHVGLAGSIVLQRDEMNATTEDSMILTILALIAVLLLFIISFRMISAPLLAILNLIIGILWALGVASLLVPYLNLFTVMMSVVLVGLGIDFSIHIISLYSELINKGRAHSEAIIETLVKTGSGIITGGFTTAGAFLTLLISRSTAMKEFGLVCGIGLICIMLSSLLCLPTLLTLKSKIKSSVKKTRDVSFQPLGLMAEQLSNKWKSSAVIIVIVTIFMAILASKMTFDYNFLNLEPVGLECIEMNDKIIDKFNMSTESTMMTATSLEENYRLTQLAKKKSTIRMVESITEFLPAPEQQAVRRPVVQKIHNQVSTADIQQSLTEQDWLTIIDELYRLEANIIEMQDLAFTGGQDMVDNKAARLVGNPDNPKQLGQLTSLVSRVEAERPHASRLNRFQNNFATVFQQNATKMSNPEEITLEMLPEMVLDKYVSKNGDRYLITTYPGKNVWNFDFLFAHTEELQQISPRATGSVPLFYFAIKFLGADGRNASLLAIFVIFLFLLIDFRSFKKAALAMIPLVFGVMWMLGIMKLAGMQFTILNVLGVPIIIGIGIDNGVHVLHRYQVEKSGSIRQVMSSTGKAIIITSLTTMLSFGSLVFATYRGFGSLGSALFIGVGACLLATLIVLPVSIKLLRE